MQNIKTYELLTALVLFLPVFSFILCLLIEEKYSWLVSITAPLILLISAALSTYLFFEAQATPIVFQYEWFGFGSYKLHAGFELNPLSLLIIFVVTVISFLVHLYSIGYMAGDQGIRKYFAMLGLFTFSMLGIVLSGNLLIMFVFWELVGFSSYILIEHRMEKPEAARAAQKAFIFNRVGDMGFIIGMMIIWSNSQTLDINQLLNFSETQSWQTAASLCLFCGVIGKSAQLPLFTWLPDAMEGPTPVSALIHAATMVTAGIFLLVRIFPVFSPVALTVVVVTGALTALLSALSALHQYDIKKILAYSTISQLGLMVTAVGVGSKDAAMLHLFTHAFFKAGLFLAAGSIIHALHHAQQQVHQDFDVQDIRNLGGLRKKLPFTFLVFCIAGASLAGIPLFSGFISKDSILTAVWSWSGHEVSWRWIILICSLSVSFITALYTFRMIWFIFIAKENKTTFTITESPWIMRAPMIALAIASAWFIISGNPVKNTGWIMSTEHSTVVTFISGGIVSAACFVAWLWYSRKSSATALPLFENAFYIDAMYKKTVGPILKFAAIAQTADQKWINGVIHLTAYLSVAAAHGVAWLDKYIIDGLVNLSAWLSGVLGSFTRSFQGGKIQLYVFWSIVGVIIFLFFALI